jgi:hypothetical protein
MIMHKAMAATWCVFDCLCAREEELAPRSDFDAGRQLPVSRYSDNSTYAYFAVKTLQYCFQ